MNLEKNKCLVIYDGYCRLCNGWVKFLIKHDRNDVFRFIQNHLIDNHDMRLNIPIDLENSVLVYFEDDYYSSSDAIIQIIKLLPNPWRLFRLISIIPKLLRDRIYAWIARNRIQMFGRYSTCPIIPENQTYKFLD